jgi:hypothetical protein
VWLLARFRNDTRWRDPYRTASIALLITAMAMMDGVRPAPSVYFELGFLSMVESMAVEHANTD